MITWLNQTSVFIVIGLSSYCFSLTGTSHWRLPGVYQSKVMVSSQGTDSTLSGPTTTGLALKGETAFSFQSDRLHTRFVAKWPPPELSYHKSNKSFKGFNMWCYDVCQINQVVGLTNSFKTHPFSTKWVYIIVHCLVIITVISRTVRYQLV